MLAPLLAALLSATPELWVATEGFERETCDAEALAAAVRAQRPAAVVHASRAEVSELPANDAVLVRLTAGVMTVRLEISLGGSAGRTVVRDLSPTESCERNVELAALIVDGALDEVAVAEVAPEVDSLAPPIPWRKRLQLGAAVGGGLEQGALGFVPTLEVEGVARVRFFELTLDADFGFPESTALTSTLVGNTSLSVTSLTLELGLGIAPRLGPGRLSADVLLGVGLAFAYGAGDQMSRLFQSSLQTAPEPLAGLRLGYLFELPFGFFAGARAEERLAFGRTAFQVSGTDPLPTVITRAWTFQAVGLLGYRFL